MTAKQPDKIKFISLAALAVVFIIVIYAFKFSFAGSNGLENPAEGEADISREGDGAPVIGLADSFFESEAFFSSIELASVTKGRPDVKAIIVPHHLVAAEYIAKMIRSAAGRTIKTAVVIGPNHENLGADPVAGAAVDFETPFGLLRHDRELAAKLLAGLNLVSRPEIFKNEHSVGAIMPFVKYYFNDARIIPIMVSSYADRKDMDKLSDWLAANLDESSLVIYSLDFSHYLTKDEADKNDDITRELISSSDIGKIFTLNNDFVDSPPVLALSLMYAEKRGLGTDFNFHGNSYDFAALKPAATTSYLAISFLTP